MAINQNHLFEELNGIKCAVVEKNAIPARVGFLKTILEYNGYVVVTAVTPPAKLHAAKPAAEPVSEADISPVNILAAETFTVGVTDVMFNATNAVFGRLLKTPGGQTVTLAFWQQKESIPRDEIPYFQS